MNGCNSYIVTMTMWLPTLPPEGPRYLAIAEAIAADVTDGRLSAGTRLPPQRQLAWKLGVTLGTVTRAYAEAERRGLVAGEVGRGTYVRGRSTPKRRSGDLAPESGDAGPIAFNQARPPELIEEASWRETLEAVARGPGWRRLLDYSPSAGPIEHRRAGADWLAACGLEVPAERVLLTAGAQAALHAAFSALARPGDRLFLGELNFPGVYSLAHQLGLRPTAVACDAGGLLPEALAEACRRADAEGASGGLLYLVPTLHNPTSVTLDARRREAIAETVAAQGLRLVEDDIFARLAPVSLPPVSTLVPDRGYYVSSLSKTTAPGLRCGLLVCPEGTAAPLLAALDTGGGKPSPITTEVARRWIEDGTVERVLGRVREEMESRRLLAQALLGPERCVTAPGSLYAWLQLPEGWYPGDFAAAALERGVAVNQARPFAVEPRYESRAVRICFGRPTDPSELRRGLTVLADLLQLSPDRRFEHLV